LKTPMQFHKYICLQKITAGAREKVIFDITLIPFESYNSTANYVAIFYWVARS